MGFSDSGLLVRMKWTVRVLPDVGSKSTHTLFMEIGFLKQQWCRRSGTEELSEGCDISCLYHSQKLCLYYFSVPTRVLWSRKKHYFSQITELPWEFSHLFEDTSYLQQWSWTLILISIWFQGSLLAVKVFDFKAFHLNSKINLQYWIREACLQQLGICFERAMKESHFAQLRSLQSLYQKGR